MTCKVRAILKARRIWNAHMERKGIEVVDLNQRENDILLPWSSDMSKTWEQNFRARWAHMLDKKAARTADAKRVAKQREPVVQRHFYGDFGLQKELIAAGIMDPVTFEIRDPRRLLNFDETSQMADGTATGTRKKGYGKPGIRLLDKQTQNRETMSVGMTWGLCGFQYGPHYNFGRLTYSAQMSIGTGVGIGFANELYMKRFDDAIDVKQKKVDEAAALAALEAAYERCRPACACGVDPCPMQKATRCDTCRKISEKGHVCKKRECVAARKGPMPAVAAAPASALGALQPPAAD